MYDRVCIVAVVTVFGAAAVADVITVVPGESIQDAIDAAMDGDEIIVEPGTYVELINFEGKVITLRSTDPDDLAIVATTVLDGAGAGPVVTCNSGEGGDTVVEGLVITGGNGSGMVNEAADPTVMNCVFSGCMAVFGGGMSNSNANPTVINCSFIGNSAQVAGGAVVNFESSPAMINCLFGGNTAVGAGGMLNYPGSNPTVVNCTFVGNSAISGGALFDEVGSGPSIVNCVVWGNSPELLQINVQFPGATKVCFSNVEGGFSGMGNIDADPMFVDPDGGDYRLSSGSPCIDAGNNWGLPQDAFDLDGDGDVNELIPAELGGNPRFADDPTAADTGCGAPVVVDMGAYELPGKAGSIMPGDVDGSGAVGVVDLLLVLGGWGACGPECCPADLDLDSNVGVTDLLIVLASWS